jgi:hypothetical protein
VAVVAGASITVAEFNHWELVAARTQAAENPGQAVIAPNDPPGFAHCIATVRKSTPSLAKAPAKVLKGDCSTLFRSLSSQVLDFLIKADWYQDDSARYHLTPGAAKVGQALNAAKQRQFGTQSQYEDFLRRTGQTDADLRYRFAINLELSALLARQTGSSAARQAAVNREVTAIFRPQTVCAPLYSMSDCSNYSSPTP